MMDDDIRRETGYQPVFSVHWTTGLLQLLDADVLPHHFLAHSRSVFADAMYLQGDHAFGGQVICEVGSQHAIDKSLDAAAPAFDARFIPFALLEGLPRGFVVLQVEEPATAALVIHAASVGTGAGVDLKLVAMHTVSGEFLLLAVDLHLRLRRVVVAAELNSRVHRRIDLELDLQDEIGILLGGAEEGIPRVRHRLAHHRAVLHSVFRFAAVLLPAGEGFAIKQRDKGVLGMQGGDKGQNSGEREEAGNHRPVINETGVRLFRLRCIVEYAFDTQTASGFCLALRVVVANHSPACSISHSHETLLPRHRLRHELVPLPPH